MRVSGDIERMVVSRHSSVYLIYLNFNFNKFDQMNLDVAVLRTLVSAVDLGGLGKAAQRLGRTPSAVSMQIRGLESQLGTQVFGKNGRGVHLTAAGEMLYGYARQMLRINDEAVATMRGIHIEGVVRFGMPQDLADDWLPVVLAQFRRAHKHIQIDIRVDRNNKLLELINREQLDLALIFGKGTLPSASLLANLPSIWIGPPKFQYLRECPVPLLMLESPCLFRSAAISALDAADTPWTLPFSSESLSSVWAAVKAGLGITVRTPVGIPNGLERLGPKCGLPELPAIDLSIHSTRQNPTPAVARLKSLLIEAVVDSIAGQL